MNTLAKEQGVKVNNADGTPVARDVIEAALAAQEKAQAEAKAKAE